MQLSPNSNRLRHGAAELMPRKTELTSWVKRLPKPLRILLGTTIGILLWPVVIIIVLLDNIKDSVQDFFKWSWLDIKRESHTFVEFFKQLWR